MKTASDKKRKRADSGDRPTVIVPHTSLHDIRTPLYKALGDRVGDVVVLYDKVILEPSDYPDLKRVAEEKLRGLSVSSVYLVLTGSYAACVLVYGVLRDLGFDVTLLQYDPHLRTYVEVRP